MKEPVNPFAVMIARSNNHTSNIRCSVILLRIADADRYHVRAADLCDVTAMYVSLSRPLVFTMSISRTGNISALSSFFKRADVDRYHVKAADIYHVTAVDVYHVTTVGIFHVEAAGLYHVIIRCKGVVQ